MGVFFLLGGVLGGWDHKVKPGRKQQTQRPKVAAGLTGWHLLVVAGLPVLIPYRH